MSSEALERLAAELRAEKTPISPLVVESPTRPFHDSYVLEAVREGYLLHYGEPRLMAGHDDDLALLAGDYLYALAIHRLAENGDLVSVARLADLIMACARLHVEGRSDEVPPLWEAAAAASADQSAPSQ
jgi:hypothetical protein